MNNPNCGICGHLNQRGYCNLTACIMPNIKTDSIRKVKQTNADKLRAMNDEKLADVFTCIDMFLCPVKGADCTKEPSCTDCFSRWLKQEAEP